MGRGFPVGAGLRPAWPLEEVLVGCFAEQVSREVVLR